MTRVARFSGEGQKMTTEPVSDLEAMRLMCENGALLTSECRAVPLAEGKAPTAEPAPVRDGAPAGVPSPAVIRRGRFSAN